MTGLYTPPQLELLVSLINESNPGLLEPRDLVNTELRNFTAITPVTGSIADTQIEVYALPGSMYTGKVTVKYRRIDLGRLFRNMILQLDDYNANQTVISPATWVPLINAKYGLNIGPESLSSLSSLVSGSSYNQAVNSACYKGTFTVRWTRSDPTVKQAIPVDTLKGLYWDGRYEESKPLLSILAAGTDYSRFKGTGTVINGSLVTDLIDIREMCQWFSNITGVTIDPAIDHTVKGGIKGLNIFRRAIPDTTFVDANPRKFNTALIIQGISTSWFSGNIIFHYNPIKV